VVIITVTSHDDVIVEVHKIEPHYR